MVTAKIFAAIDIACTPTEDIYENLFFHTGLPGF